MKEKILWPIIQKAREDAETNTPIGGKNFDLDMFHEKFAELLVRKCAEQAYNLADMLSMHRDKAGAEIAESVGNTIKEYFGVEE